MLVVKANSKTSFFGGCSSAMLMMLGVVAMSLRVIGKDFQPKCFLHKSVTDISMYNFNMLLHKFVVCRIVKRQKIGEI